MYLLEKNMKIVKIITFLTKKVKSLGVRLIYSTMLMVYAFQSDKTPIWAKRIILGAMAYLMSPIDGIPDLTPMIGFTDDLGIISFGLVSIACYIDNDVRTKAKTKLISIIGNVDEKELNAVDSLL